MKLTLFTLAIIPLIVFGDNPFKEKNNFGIKHLKNAPGWEKASSEEKIKNPIAMDKLGDENENPFVTSGNTGFNPGFIDLNLETGEEDSFDVLNEKEFQEKLDKQPEGTKYEGDQGTGSTKVEFFRKRHLYDDDIEDLKKRSVHDRDSREQTRHTRDYPHRLIGQLYFKTNTGGWASCSATMVSKDKILTNGHCVCNGNGVWYSNFRFYPSRDADGGYYGNYISGNHITTNTAYFSRGDSTYDYAVIRLTSSIGNTLGWLGLWSISDTELSGTGTKALPLILEGYPGDKPSGTNWFGACSVYVSNYASIYHTCDTYGGQSGSGLSTISKGYRYIIGVHNLGYTGSGYNRAVRLSTSRFNQIVSWLT